MTSVKPLWAAATSTDWSGWRLLATLVPANRGVSPQGIVRLGDTWVVSQGDTSDNLTLTRFNDAGQIVGRLVIPRGGHGDRMRVEGGNRIGVFVTGVWCSIPWQTGTLTPKTVVAKYRATYRMLPFGARAWFQGEITDLDGQAIRLYGVPYREYGPSVVDGVRRPDIATHLEFYRDGVAKPVKTENLRPLGRNAAGLPYDDRLEPEGLAVGQFEGHTCLLVGIVNGRAGHSGFTYRIYGRIWRG